MVMIALDLVQPLTWSMQWHSIGKDWPAGTVAIQIVQSKAVKPFEAQWL
jgi:hypothetical protein